MIEFAPEASTGLTYEEAVLYCTFCRYGGHSDWRLPTKDEFNDNVNLFGWYVGRKRREGDSWVVTPVRDIEYLG